MSDHPEVPRVEFDESGYSMNKEEAVARFRRLLETAEERMLQKESGWAAFSIKVEIRPCDCDSTLAGHDEYCALHGDKS
jgi:hypothetical protein